MKLRQAYHRLEQRETGSNRNSVPSLGGRSLCLMAGVPRVQRRSYSNGRLQNRVGLERRELSPPFLAGHEEGREGCAAAPE